MKKNRVIAAAFVAACVAESAFLGEASANPGPAERTDFLYITFDAPGPDYRLFAGDGDWRYGFAKTECGPSFPTMVGIGSVYDYTPGLLCGTSDVIRVNYWNGVSVWFGPGSDHRLDTSTGDWARGYDKAECASNQVLTGVAEQNEGINEFRCSAASTTVLGTALHATSCAAVDFDGHDGYDYYYGSHRGDWFYRVDKGSCGVNRYIKGFSVSRGSSYKANKILCCGPQLTPDGLPCNADEQCAGGRCTTSGLCLTPVVK